jgi:hypothetical protein
MEERKVQRRPFRTLGMRMQNFGRQLIHNYMASTNLPAPADLPPAWREDAETPLIWRKPDETDQQIEAIDDLDQGDDHLPQVDFTPQQALQQPVRRKPAPAQPQRSGSGIDPRLSQILAFHQQRQKQANSPVPEESRPSPPPQEDIRRQADEGHAAAPPGRRRRASIDYVETSALKPPVGDVPSSPASHEETLSGDPQHDETELDEEGESTWEDRWDTGAIAPEDMPATTDVQRAPDSGSSPQTGQPIDGTEAQWDADGDEELPYAPEPPVPHEEMALEHDAAIPTDSPERDLPGDPIQRMSEAAVPDSGAGRDVTYDHEAIPDSVYSPPETEAAWPQDERTAEDEGVQETIQRASEPHADRSQLGEPARDGDIPEDSHPAVESWGSEPHEITPEWHEEVQGDTGSSYAPADRVQRAPESEPVPGQLAEDPGWDIVDYQGDVGDHTPVETVQRERDTAAPDMDVVDNEEGGAIFEDIVDHQRHDRRVQRAPEPQTDSRQADAAPEWDSDGGEYEDMGEEQTPVERVQRAPEEAPHEAQADVASSMVEPVSVVGEDSGEVETPHEVVQRAPDLSGESTPAHSDMAPQSWETGADRQMDQPEPHPLEGLGDEVEWEPEWVTDVGAAMPKPLNVADERVQRAPDPLLADRNDAEVDWYADVDGPPAIQDASPEPVQRAAEPYYIEDYEDNAPGGEEHSVDLYEALMDAGMVEPPPTPRGRPPDAPPPSDIARKPEPQEDDGSYAIVPQGYEDGSLITDITTISSPPTEISPQRSEPVISRAPAEEPPDIICPQPEIGYTSPQPEVMRQTSVRQVAQRPELSPVAEEETSAEEPSEEQNIEQLARNVYRVLRDRLRIERERGDRLQGRR